MRKLPLNFLAMNDSDGLIADGRWQGPVEYSFALALSRNIAGYIKS